MAEKDMIISQNVRGACASISTKLNMQEKIALANQWCNRHPLIVFLVALLTLAISTAVTLRSFINYQEQEAMPLFDAGLFEGNAALRAMSMTETSKDMVAEKMRQVVAEVQQDIDLIDSIMARPVLTHQDSMRVWAAAERLNAFNQNFSNDED